MPRLVVTALLAFLVACSSEGANQLLGGAPRQNAPAPSQDEPSPSEPVGESSGGGGSSSESGGTSSGGTSSGAPPDAGSDAGADAGGNSPANAFTGALAYTANLGPSARNAAHPDANGNPAKRNCLRAGCHGGGGAAPLFVTGGTVFADVAGTLPAANVEVRLRGATGQAASAYTDGDGNFYLRAVAIAFPAHTGLRDAVRTQVMQVTIANGACNAAACHGGPQGPIHIP